MFCLFFFLVKFFCEIFYFLKKMWIFFFFLHNGKETIYFNQLGFNLLIDQSISFYHAKKKHRRCWKVDAK